MIKLVFIPIADEPRAWEVHGDASISKVYVEEDQTPVQAYMQAKGESAPSPDLVFMRMPGPTNQWSVEGDPEIQTIAARAGQWPVEAYDEVKVEQEQDAGYRDDRYAKYPPVRDQLDAVAKMGIALREQGLTLPDDVNVWLDTIEDIKAQHPKPDEA